MTEKEVLEAVTTPLNGPAYGKGALHFVNREFFIISYRTDPAAIAKVVPAPLKPAAPIVSYEFIRMPDSSGLGDYTESGQVIPVTLDGEPGGYTHAMYLDDFPAIASGREIMGYPKMFANPRVEVRRDAIVGTLDYNGVRVATATMGYKYDELDKAAVAKSMSGPGFLLKKIPNLDFSPRICEIVKFWVSDLVVKGAWTGPATLELHPHVLAPLAALPVLEILSARHIIADLSLGRAEVAYDYLANQSARKAG